MIVETMQLTIRELHLSERSDEECKSMIGYRLEEIPLRLWPDIAGLSDQYVTKQGWAKAETLVVGDMNVDILMGKRAGTATCGVTYGNGSVAELEEAGADYIISDFSVLADV